MELLFRFFGFELSMRFGLTADDEVESYSLDSDLAFGFSPDPVFPDLIWEEEDG